MPTTSAEADFTGYVVARQRHLTQFAYLLTGDAHSAEDLVQSAFARAYRHWSTMKNKDAYVRRCIVNEHASWWRRTWRHREVVASHLVALVEPTTLPAVEPDDGLRSRVHALPRRQRAAIMLRYFEDLSEAQTAELLGCSVGTVKSTTARALKALRTGMQEQEVGR